MLLATNQEKTINIMTIQESINLLQSLADQTTKKYEIKIYKEFIQILNGLDKRDLSNEDITSIEKKLQDLNLESNPRYRKRYFKKQLYKFKGFLEKSFSLTTKNYFLNYYVSLGMLFGVVIGVLIGERSDKSMGISLGISIGMMVGVLIGKAKDAKALSEGRII